MTQTSQPSGGDTSRNPDRVYDAALFEKFSTCDLLLRRMTAHCGAQEMRAVFNSEVLGDSVYLAAWMKFILDESEFRSCGLNADWSVSAWCVWHDAKGINRGRGLYITDDEDGSLSLVLADCENRNNDATLKTVPYIEAVGLVWFAKAERVKITTAPYHAETFRTADPRGIEYGEYVVTPQADGSVQVRHEDSLVFPTLAAYNAWAGTLGVQKIGGAK